MINNESEQRWLDAGMILRAHGVRGDMRAVIDVPLDVLTNLKSLRLVARDGVSQQFELTDVRPIDRGVLLNLAGIMSREAAQAWNGAALQLLESDIPPAEPGEFYIYELNGVAVLDDAGRALGRVEAVLDNGGQPLLRLNGDRLLPLVPDVVLEFRRSAGALVVQVPQGLWDENAVEI